MNESINFNDICTDFTCSALTSEVIKFLIHSKQQIPISYDKLRDAVDRSNTLGPNASRQSYQSDKLLKSAREGVAVLQEVFTRLSDLFSRDLPLSEIAFLFGGSPLTPKQVYRFHLPYRELGHKHKFHSGQSVLNDMLQYIVKSDKLSKLLSMPMAPTNMFVLLKLHQGDSDISWFLPKPRYDIPKFGQQVHLNCNFKQPDCIPCTCKGFEFYSEDGGHEPSRTVANGDCIPPASRDDDTPIIWYQAPLIFKGFQDSYVQGVSVTRSWMTGEVSSEQIMQS